MLKILLAATLLLCVIALVVTVFAAFAVTFDFTDELHEWFVRKFKRRG